MTSAVHYITEFDRDPCPADALSDDLGLTVATRPVSYGSIPYYISFCFPQFTDIDVICEGVRGSSLAATPSRSRIAAAGEAMEILCAKNPTPSRLLDALSLPKTNRFDCAKFSKPWPDCHQEATDHDYMWVEAQDILRGDTQYVPAQLVYSNSRFAHEPTLRPEFNSCGTAFGPDGVDHARLHALLELIERDASLNAFLNCPTLVKIEGEPRHLTATLHALKAQGLEVTFFDITTGLAAPAVLAICTDHTGGRPAVTTGSSAKLNYAAAMERALCEALQSRFGLKTLLDQDPQACEDIFPGRELGGLNRALFWANPRNQSLITNLTDRYTRVAFSDLEDFSTTQERILQELSARDWTSTKSISRHPFWRNMAMRSKS